MANPWAGEVALVIDGQRRILKLTLGALAELEQDLNTTGLVGLVERFERADYSTADVISVLIAGLRGGGWSGQRQDLLASEIEGGLLKAVAAAGAVLAHAFSLPSDG